MAMIKTCTGRQPTVLGKPNPMLLNIIIKECVQVTCVDPALTLCSLQVLSRSVAYPDGGRSVLTHTHTYIFISEKPC